MAKFNGWIALLAVPALGACETMTGDPAATAPGGAASAAAEAPKVDVYAGKSVLDAAIAAAGGETALRAAHELDWTGTATVTAEGKTTELDVQTIMRPFTFARATSSPKGEGVKSAKTIQMDFGKVWSVSRVTWTPMPLPQEANEVQQFALYGVMMLTTLKDPGVKVTETAPGKDGTRNLHVEHPKAPPMDLRFDASGKLIRAADTVSDPADAAKKIAQVIEFSGEVSSNGVKWPQRIVIKQNDPPYYDLQIAKFEARGSNSVIPLEHTLRAPGTPDRTRGEPGAEN